MMQSEDLRPSVGYYLTFVAAMIGVVIVTVALDGMCLSVAGRDPEDAINGSGTVAFICMWMILYYQRLAFWSRVSPSRQAVVTLSLRILLIVEVIAAVAGSVYVFISPAASGGTQAFMAIADLLQVGTVLWIVRYSRE